MTEAATPLLVANDHVGATQKDQTLTIFGVVANVLAAPRAWMDMQCPEDPTPPPV